MTELDTHQFTHYSSNGHFESRIDRVFWSLPPWCVKALSILRPNFPPAHTMNSQRLSDHSPVAIVVSPSSPLSPSSRPIPSFVTKHPHYRKMIAEVEKKYNISYSSLMASSDGNPFLALARYKYIIRQIAKRTRNAILQIGRNQLADDLLFSTMSRCLLMQDGRLASFLIVQYPLASRHIRVSCDGCVSMKHPAAFSDELRACRHDTLNNDLQQCDLDAGRARSQTSRERLRKK
eukprot:2542049-Karenia_brevis.AAC.1